MSEPEKQEVPVEEPVQTEEEPKEITKKDPRRVEQGKRLAAISKEAKEKKMRKRIREEEFSYLPWIGYGISIFATFTTFYLLFSGSDDKKPEPEILPPTPKKVPSKPKKNFEGFG